MRDVEGAIGEGERAAVPDVQLEPRRQPQARLAYDRGGQDLGAAVDAGHPKVAAVPGGSRQEGGGDIGRTRADIEDRQGRRGRPPAHRSPVPTAPRHRAIDWSARGRAGCHAGRPDRPAAHPAVPRHRTRASPEQATRRLPSGHDRRRRRGPHGPDRRAGRERRPRTLVAVRTTPPGRSPASVSPSRSSAGSRATASGGTCGRTWPATALPRTASSRPTIRRPSPSSSSTSTASRGTTSTSMGRRRPG